MSEALSRPQAITKVAEMIKEIRIAMLSTVTSEGAIHSRPMASREAEFQGEQFGQDAGRQTVLADVPPGLRRALAAESFARGPVRIEGVAIPVGEAPEPEPSAAVVAVLALSADFGLGWLEKRLRPQ